MLELIILAASVCANLCIGLVAYSKNRASHSNQLFAVLAFALVTWPIVNYFSVHSSTHQLLYIRVVLLLVVLMNTAFYALASAFPKLKYRPNLLDKLAFIYSAVVGVAVMTPLVFSGAIILANSTPSPIPAPGILLFVVDLIFFVGGGLFKLWSRQKRAKGLEKAQLRLMLLGSVVMYSLAIIINFILAVWLHLPGLVILGPLYTVIFAGSIAYAMVRHRLFDIRLVVARSVAYALLLATLAVLYAGALFGASAIFFANQSTSLAQSVVSIAIAIVLAFTFQPLRRFFQRLTDRVFYRDSYDSQAVLNAVGKVMAEEINLDRLLKNSLEIICQAMKVEMGQFMIFDKNRIFKVEHFGPLPSKIMVVPTMAKLHHPLLVADELEGGQRKKILDEHSVRVSLMLRTKNTLVGFLFLGDKLSGDIYTDQDLQLLQILAQELSIAILNAKAYAEIAQFNVTLQQRVHSATARLQVANRNLKALDSAKDEFISMASHQLRTPLTTIKGYISMMLEGDTGQINLQQQEFLGYAYEGAERMVSLISDLLNVSRLSAGRFVIEKKPTDLVAVVADEVRQLRRHAEAKNLELKFTPPKRKLPLIDLDEGKTRQVIMNFIDNAIYYTKQGGVYITLTTDKSSVRLTVRDTGIGVPESARKQLFTKFFRAENAQAARPDGTGLGLYLAKQVVEDQGGTIIFESKQDHGSTFGFSIPLRISSKSARVKPVTIQGSTPNVIPVAESGKTLTAVKKITKVHLG